MKNESRLERLETRLGVDDDGRPLRTVFVYDGEPEPQAQDGERLFIVRVVYTAGRAIPGPADPEPEDSELEAAVDELKARLERLKGGGDERKRS